LRPTRAIGKAPEAKRKSNGKTAAARASV